MNKKITLLAMLAFIFQFSSAQTIMSEGFEGATFPPANWTSFIGTNGLGTVYNWVRTDARSNSGSNSAANRYENVTGGVAQDWLVTSQIDLSSSTNTQLRFYSGQTYAQEYGSNYEVRVSTNSQNVHTDFTTVATYNETTVGPTDGFDLKTVDLSAYDGMMVYIAFVHLNDDGDNWFIDDIEVRSPQPLDAKLDAVNLNRYSLTSVNNPLSVVVTNNGLNTITSLDITWSDGTNNYPQTFNVNIPSGGTQTINHSTPVNYATVDEQLITATITGVNGTTDADASNNVMDADFNTISQSGVKKVFIEEGTGTWCGFCPRGTLGMEYMANTYPETTVLVAVHNADQMSVPTYDNAFGTLIGGYPSSVIDRNLLDVDPNQSDLQSAYNSLINDITPADVGIEATLSGNTLNITASANFYTIFSAADFRFAVIITEDGVTGTGDGTNANQLDYDQVNYYSGGGLGPMGGYENLPDPVPATQMVYDHVARAILGGFNGEVGSVPTSIANGQSVTHSFTYNIPATSNQANMHIAVVLIDQNDGSVVSATSSTVAEALSIDEVSALAGIKIYPNPAKDLLIISFAQGTGSYEIKVTDMLGRTVINGQFSNVFGSSNIELPVSQLSAGNYILNITSGSNSYSTKFIVNN